MNQPQSKFKVSIRYEVQKVLVDDGGRENYTGERLSIDDQLDLADSFSLTELLARINDVHELLQRRKVADV